MRSWRRWGVVVLEVAVGLGAATAADAQGPKGAAAASTADLEEAGRLNVQVGTLYRTGRYGEAELPAQRALAIREKVLGPDHPDVATALNNIAMLYEAKGEYGRAEPLYRRALAIWEKALGPDHPDVATALNNLAALYHSKGEYGRAEPLLQRALAIWEKALGPDHPDVASSLNNLAELYDSKGEYGRAEPLLQRALAISEKALGPDHPDVASSLNNLAALFKTRGEYSRAEPLLQRALAISEKALGPDHPDVASSLNNLAALYQERGDFGRAEPLYHRALTISEKALGPDHPDVASALNHLAALYQAKGDFGRAEPLYQRALAIRETALGPDHPVVASSVNNLALLYTAKGEYGRAEPLLQRALAISEKALAPDHPEVASSLNNLAFLYTAKGQYDRAEPLYQRSLAILEKALAPDHPKVASSLNNLAALYREKGDLDRAEPLYQRALAIREKVLGPDHPDAAASLNNLASLYQAKGKYGQAESLYQRALAISEKALGPDHPEVASYLDNLAGLYQAKGEYGRAEPLYQRALAICEKALGPDHRNVALPLNNLAGLYQAKGDYARSEPLFQRALAILEKALGPDHPDVATSLNNLANLYNSKVEYDRAEHFYLRAFAIRGKSLKSDHPDLANSLNNLATLYWEKGQYDRAEPLLQRALAIFEKALGPDHPDVATSLNNLAMLYWTMDRLPDAVRFQNRAYDVNEKLLTLLVSAGSEAQNLIYVSKLQGEHDSTVDLALSAREPVSAGLALTLILHRKGRALDATAGSVRALRARLGSEEQKFLDALNSARARYATLVLRGPGPTPLVAYKNDLGALRNQIQEQEAAISKRSATFRAQLKPVTVTAVQGALPDTAALVEWVAYQPFNLKARNQSEKWGPFRYAACVLPNHGAPTCIDLGDLKTIDADIHTLRAALRRPASDAVPTLSRALEARVMAPVRALLGNTHRVYLSPDGALNLVPFAALPDETGHPLIERYAFTYLTSGRDLLRLAAHLPAEQGSLILANPDFDAGTTPGAGRFPPLLHAEEEAAAASRVFPGAPAPVLRFDQATKATLLKAHGPRLLHIGTHGFFEPIACSTQADSSALTNPLLQSGIALAGANACASGHDEGILTAFEAAGLDLYGTKLAVLSACQTGVGDAKAGDGVYGLRRALVLAGAETQVMSLWPVEGAATATLMKAYYERLARGEGRSEAMRQVQLAMLHTPGREHPYYWAPFIVSGDDRTLADKAVEPDLRVHPGGACACRVGGEVPEGQAAWLAVAVALGWVRRRGRGAGGGVRAGRERTGGERS